MRRVFNVVRLQMINRAPLIWVPLIVLAGAVVLSVLIYAMIPVDTPKYGGGGQAPLWVFFGVGMSAMTLTFPFSQAISITRREFFIGTMLTAVISSAFMGLLFLIGGGIELLTDGWGVNGWVFHLPDLWTAGPAGAFVIFFTLALFFFVTGFTGATIYKRWGAMTISLVGVGIGLLLVAVAFVITRLELWMQVGRVLGELGALGIALWGLVGVVGLMAVSYLTLRRATP
ncbi:hypothetical protein FVO59_06205 [Microbacterium esteraromaticum]|uniref:Uncharacterized protein n=1 Tax=Microbacterium esteraromaticum TaxID=57043 RepID=A0A7D7W950_9MICO|nr:hypothetical protein [Microbacterium esteraromaticum]QMU96858.1 hypothetical protein FVO59_06205 [Microbacterium esteraromaticum]